MLEHLPQRSVIASKLVGASKPGGWLVIEDYDIRTMALTDRELPSWTLMNQAIVGVLRAAGSDPLYGSQLRRLLLATHLDDITVEGFLRPTTIPDLAPIFRSPLEQLREPLRSSGAVTSAQLQQAFDAFEDHDDPPTPTRRSSSPPRVGDRGPDGV